MMKKYFIIVIIVVVILVGFYSLARSSKNPRSIVTTNKSASAKVSWYLDKGNVWKPTDTPPPCPEPLVLTTPVDLGRVTAILYPGQPRGGAFKPHGAFRFSNQSDNQAIIKVPFNAQVVRGSRAFRNGENQYAFEFIAPCGIFYSFGHLLELTPKFKTIADKLPLIGDFAKQQFFDVTPPIIVTTGEVIATAVGYAKDHNVFVDWGVFDLRKKNGAKLRPEWVARYSQELDEYAVCWLDLLPTEDREHLRGLFGSGDAETGVLSDYCHYPENK